MLIFLNYLGFSLFIVNPYYFQQDFIVKISSKNNSKSHFNENCPPTSLFGIIVGFNVEEEERKKKEVYNPPYVD